jgi:hypothetical protein
VVTTPLLPELEKQAKHTQKVAELQEDDGAIAEEFVRLIVDEALYLKLLHE